MFNTLSLTGWYDAESDTPGAAALIIDPIKCSLYGQFQKCIIMSARTKLYAHSATYRK